MTRDSISERSKTFLKTIVDMYIRDGQPVASKTLAQQMGGALSPATIRNVMADLEEMGFIRSPHTSAGRVPTVAGYRFFVDALLTHQPVVGDQIASLQAELSPDCSALELVEKASLLVSQLTRQAGLITVPNMTGGALRQVEFLPLSGSRVLVILVVNEKEVQNRVIHTSRPYGADELTRAANYVNQHLSGLPLSEVKAALEQSLAQDQACVDRYLREALQEASLALAPEGSGDCIVAGQFQLLESAVGEDVSVIRELLATLDHKKDVLHLLERSVDAGGVKIYIGGEVGAPVVEQCSLVTAPYYSGDQRLGVLGVIGPSRMAYERIIPIVDLTARMLSRALV